MKPHISTSVWAFVDLLFNLLLMTLYTDSMKTLPYPNAAAVVGISPGKMCAELSWPPTFNIDIDLWGRGPNQEIIYHKNHSGDLLDLLRDDLGSSTDQGPHNFETMCSREMLKGEWTFNARYYSNHDYPAPVDVPIRLTLRFLADGPMKNDTIIKSGVLHKGGDEITMLDFTLDEKGRVGGVNQVYQKFNN